MAERLLGPVRAAAGEDFDVAATPCTSQIGSGALPLEEIVSHGLALTPKNKKISGRLLDPLAQRLRSMPIPIIGRISDGAMIFDLRTLDDEKAFAEQLQNSPLPAARGAS